MFSLLLDISILLFINKISYTRILYPVTLIILKVNIITLENSVLQIKFKPIHIYTRICSNFVFDNPIENRQSTDDMFGIIQLEYV